MSSASQSNTHTFEGGLVVFQFGKLFIIALALYANGVFAKDVYISGSDSEALQEAIDAANNITVVERSVTWISVLTGLAILFDLRERENIYRVLFIAAFLGLPALAWGITIALKLVWALAANTTVLAWLRGYCTTAWRLASIP